VNVYDAVITLFRTQFTLALREVKQHASADADNKSLRVSGTKRKEIFIYRDNLHCNHCKSWIAESEVCAITLPPITKQMTLLATSLAKPVPTFEAPLDVAEAEKIILGFESFPDDLLGKIFAHLPQAER
jgi:hypothetical protein